MSNTIHTGNTIEELAVEYLQNTGILILHRNFRCHYGEIDIIAQDHDSLVFIEVRYRKNDAYGHPTETVTDAKQQKIIASAQYYLQSRTWAQALACRFDVVAVTMVLDKINFEWVKDAFHA